MKKVTNFKVTNEFLKSRISEKYGKQKWIQFCEILIQQGYTCYLHEARRTFSKYIKVTNSTGKEFIVRFSNHKPIKYREERGDCDFFVGVTHLGTSTTEDALNAVYEYMEGDSCGNTYLV